MAQYERDRQRSLLLKRIVEFHRQLYYEAGELGEPVDHYQNQLYCILCFCQLAWGRDTNVHEIMRQRPHLHKWTDEDIAEVIVKDFTGDLQHIDYKVRPIDPERMDDYWNDLQNKRWHRLDAYREPELTPELLCEILDTMIALFKRFRNVIVYRMNWNMLDVHVNERRLIDPNVV